MSKVVIVLKVNVLEVALLVGGIYILTRGAKFLRNSLKENGDD